MTLLYPQWLPGNHAPNGPMKNSAGLVFRAGGKVDPLDARPGGRLRLPRRRAAGATSLDARVPVPLAAATRPGPRRHDAGDAEPAVDPGGAVPGRLLRPPHPDRAQRPLPGRLEVATRRWRRSGTADGVTRFKPVAFETLVDSPMFAGRYFRQIDLDPGGPAPVRLDVVADRPELLDATPDQIDAHRALVQQAYKLFGSHHYDHYDFLFSLTDRMGGIGLEHHRSSEDGTDPRLLHRLGQDARLRATCCPTSTPTPGTASSAARPTSGRPTTTCRCAAACSGSTRARRSTGATCCPARSGLLHQAGGAGRAGRHRRHSTRTASAANGARSRTPPTIRSSPRAGRCPGPAGSAARTTIPRASWSGSTPTP